MAEKKIFTDLFLKLSREVPDKKLKQLKFLLQDVMQNAVLRDKTLLEVITELERQNILQRSHLRPQDGHLLCEIFDALSLTEFANGICQDFEIERGNVFTAKRHHDDELFLFNSHVFRCCTVALFFKGNDGLHSK